MSVVDYQSQDHIAVVRFDDGKANALSHASMDALEAALARAEKEARAVVLTGRPGRFSAGFDLQEMMGGADRARALVTRGAEQMQLGGMEHTLSGACPDCGSQLEYAEGCAKCHVCGFSECG